MIGLLRNLSMALFHAAARVAGMPPWNVVDNILSKREPETVNFDTNRFIATRVARPAADNETNLMKFRSFLHMNAM